MHQHIDTLNRLKEQRLEEVTHKCPTCHSPTYCAILGGKSINTCWCATSPVEDKPSIYEESDCLCQTCLTSPNK